MITPWEIYWVLQLDSICGALFAVAMICGIGMSLVLLVACIARSADDLGDEAWATSRRWAKRLAVATCTCVVGLAVIPSTKTAAAMIVVPQIVNSPTIQHEAGDLYKLAKEALRDAIAPKQSK